MRKIISLLSSLLIFCYVFMPLKCMGDDFSWTMFLPGITGEFKICSSDPQTMTWEGLEWQRCDNGEEYQWAAANNFCQQLSLGKKTDWRLPTKDELKNLVVCTNGRPVPMADYQWCSDGDYNDNFASPTIDSGFQALATGYWTSTKQDANHAWFVNFVGGNAEVHSLQNGNHTRCVRTP